MRALACRGGEPTFASDAFPWPRADRSDEEALLSVLHGGAWWSGPGKHAPAFAAEFAEAHECRFGLAVTNGTHALQVALLAAGVRPGAEVIVPAYTFIATATAVLHAFAVPVFVDVDPGTLCIDPAAVEAAITPRTEAIVAVHFAGEPADMDALGTLADRHGLVLVEDAAQAPGATWRGRNVGSFGRAAAFSFQGTKVLTAGEGGMLVTNDADVAERAYSLVNVGRRRGGAPYEHYALGSNYRLGEFQSALLRSQFAKFPAQHERRLETAGLLDRALAAVEGLEPQVSDPRTTRHGYYSYCLRYDPEAFAGLPAEAFHTFLTSEGVPVMGRYAALHQTHLFRNLREEAPAVFRVGGPVPDYAALTLPHAERAAARVISLRHAFLLAGTEDVEAFVDLVERIRAEAPRLVQEVPGG